MNAAREALLVHHETYGSELVVAQGDVHAAGVSQGAVPEVFELVHERVNSSRQLRKERGEAPRVCC